MFFVVVLVQRQVLHAQLCAGLRHMECYGRFPFFTQLLSFGLKTSDFQHTFSPGLSLGHDCLWQSHHCHNPHDQNHPRVRREKVQKVQQRSHKVGFLSDFAKASFQKNFTSMVVHLRCLLKCCQCCLWCLEKFMRFINRNAYIMCAVKVSAILEILFCPTYFFFAEHKLLLICQVRLQPADEEPGEGGRAGQRGGLPPLPGQDCHRPADGGRLLSRLRRPHARHQGPDTQPQLHLHACGLHRHRKLLHRKVPANKKRLW